MKVEVERQGYGGVEVEVGVVCWYRRNLSVLSVMFVDVEVEVGCRGCQGAWGRRRSLGLSGSSALIIDVEVELELVSR